MSNKLLLPFGIVVVGVLTVGALVFAKPKPVPRPAAEEPAAIQVAVLPAKQESLRIAVTAQGTVIPKREIDLIAQVSGQVVSVEPDFVSGGFFEPSQVLLRIDDREYRAALLRAKAQLAEAEHRLAEELGLSHQAQREWRELGSQAANDLFLRKPQLAAAQANVESARAAVDVAELDLQRTQLSVPFDGRIKSKQVDLGEYVTAGTPIATVYDSTVVEVRLSLTEAQAALINLPLTANTVSVDHARVTISGSVAGEEHQWQGVLARTDAFVDTHSRMYVAVVEVADPFATQSADGKPAAPLLPGLFVEAKIEGKHLDDILRLPRSALYSRDKVLILDSANAVVEQQVKVLHKTEDHVWVQAGIAADALISLEKQSLTPAGTVVQPILPSGSEADAMAISTKPATNTVALKTDKAELKD